MQTLIIKDLAVTEELNRKAMATVRGGTCATPSLPSYPSYPSAPSYPGMPGFDVNKSDFNFNASQSLGQSQNTLVNNGNNVAFASGITSNVKPTQTGTNTINFG